MVELKSSSAIAFKVETEGASRFPYLPQCSDLDGSGMAMRRSAVLMANGRYQSMFNLAEIADEPSICSYQKHFTRLTISSDGNRRGRPQKDTAMERTTKRVENKIPQASDSKSLKSPNQEEIIALFRRIQSSISKGDPASPKIKSPNSYQDKPSADSVVEVLCQSKKQVKGERSSKKEGNKALTRSKGNLQKGQEVGYPSVADLRFTRPPSNFVKRSPIPSPSSPRKEAVELTIESRTATASEKKELPTLEVMKLRELKELAKSRAIKGYSKLKKSELVDLLRSS